MISRSGVCGLNFTKRSRFSTGSLCFLATVNASVGNEPDGIIQFSLTERGQRICQTAQQFVTVWPTQSNDNRAMMLSKGQRNGVEKILVRADENGVFTLG